MTSRPDISVIIPAFNVKACISRAIDSALSQSDVRIEVIVVDDCSDDLTAYFVEQTYAGDARVKVLRREANGGPGAARNDGFRVAKGDWVALLDADDWWRPERARTLLAKAANYDFVADNIMGYDAGEERETWPVYPIKTHRRLQLVDFIRPAGPNSHDYGYLQPIMRRQFIIDNGLHYDGHVRVGEDLLFNMKFMAAGGRALLLPEANYIYVLPVGPLSRAPSPHSRTVKSNSELIDAVAAFEAEYRARLTATERRMLSERLQSLRDRGPVAEFHIAKAHSDYWTMMRLVISRPQVRHRIFSRIRTCVHNTFTGLLLPYVMGRISDLGSAIRNVF